jgi:hypothetical protein
MDGQPIADAPASDRRGLKERPNIFAQEDFGTDAHRSGIGN